MRYKWHPTRKRWLFRGIVKRRKKQIPTPWVVDPYEAARAYLELRAKIDAQIRAERHVEPWPGATLAQALDVAIAQARARGVKETSIRRQWQTGKRAILRHLDGSMPIEKLTVDDVLYFVRCARAEGRSNTTILVKDLLQLDQTCRAVCVPSPVPAAKRALTTMRPNKPPPPDVLTLDEAKVLIARIRAWDPQEFPAARRDADIFEVTLYTGIRAGEWERLTRDDIDIARCAIHIRESKDHAHPRTQPVPERLREALERLVAEADKESGLVIGGGMGTIGTIGTKWRRRLEEPRFRGLRSLRHCFAGALDGVGAPLAAIAHGLGHSSTTTTDIYLRSLREGARLRSAVERIAQE